MLEIAWARNGVPIDWLMNHATDTDIATLLDISADETRRIEAQKGSRHGR